MTKNTITITEKPMVKYPKSVIFIIGNEFCERFNYYGMRTILVLYLTRRLCYDDDTATVLFHVFTSLVYFFPLFGAIIADSYWGRFKTILILSIIYALGTVIIAVGAIPPLMLPAKPVTVIGLILIALGTGGIKPCVSAFGGDQFKLPEQAKQLASFFSLFYFSINCGSLVSTTLTPILREDIHCFGEYDCFPLAFGVPAILMVLSIVVFVWGKSLYVIKAPCGNMILAVFKCITEAIRKRSSSKETKTHWLDYAENKYGSRLVEDTKVLLKILVLYLPLPVFWALFDQQGSRWTFQATNMVGHITSNFSIKPDQMQVVNPLLILMFIPLFDYVIYPVLAKCGIKTPLQKITVGGLLAAVAFLLSGLVQVAIEKNGPITPKNDESLLRIVNGMPCTYQIKSVVPRFTNITLDKLGVFEKTILLDDIILTKVGIRGISESSKCKNFTSELQLLPGNTMNYFIKSAYEQPIVIKFPELESKHRRSMPLICGLINVDKDYGALTAVHNNESISIDSPNLIELNPSHYRLKYDNIHVGDVDLHAGSVYAVIVQGNPTDGFLFNSHLLIKPNSVHMFWQLPQYIVITAGEVMFSVTGLEFSFTQAPASMKSVLQACWLLTVALGNLLVVFIAEFSKFHSQALEFFSFAILMFLDMIIFMILAMRYTYRKTCEDGDNNYQDKDVNMKPRRPQFLENKPKKQCHKKDCDDNVFQIDENKIPKLKQFSEGACDSDDYQTDHNTVPNCQILENKPMPRFGQDICNRNDSQSLQNTTGNMHILQNNPKKRFSSDDCEYLSSNQEAVQSRHILQNKPMKQFDQNVCDCDDSQTDQKTVQNCQILENKPMPRFGQDICDCNDSQTPQNTTENSYILQNRPMKRFGQDVYDCDDYQTDHSTVPSCQILENKPMPRFDRDICDRDDFQIDQKLARNSYIFQNKPKKRSYDNPSYERD